MASEKRTRALPRLVELAVETKNAETQAMLNEAIAAFASGNYAKVRSLTAELQRSRDPQVVESALELRRRVSVDRVQVAFLVLCLGVIGAIAYIYIPLP